MASELERARLIVQHVAPGKVPELACMLMQSAVAGMRGLGMRHIRIGALFWPDKFEDDPALSMRGGWGCEGYSEADKRLFLADQDVHDDGGFSGHTWLEDDNADVIDVMHNYEGLREIYGADFKIVGRYIPRRKLESNVKRFWRKQMLAAIKLGKESV